MDPQTSPWLSPAFLITAAVALIGFVAWLIRLEQKVNGHDKEFVKVNQSSDENWRELDHHRTNETIHFNQRLATEVEKRQSDRMERMESDLKEIKVLVKGIASK